MLNSAVVVWKYNTVTSMWNVYGTYVEPETEAVCGKIPGSVHKQGLGWDIGTGRVFLRLGLPILGPPWFLVQWYTCHPGSQWVKRGWHYSGYEKNW